MVQLDIYDAVITIEGGFTPSVAHQQQQPDADVRAAVAAAAYHTARAGVVAPHRE